MSCAVSLEALRLPLAGPLPKLLLPEEEGQLLPGQDSSEQTNCVQLRESHHRPSYPDPSLRDNEDRAATIPP